MLTHLPIGHPLMPRFPKAQFLDQTLLIFISINDIANNINAYVRLFADDISLYIVVDTPIVAASTLNDDLDTIYNWSKMWLVSFNPSKTEPMILKKQQQRN